MRMVELRDRLGLALEAGLALRTLGQVLGEDLDGHRAVESSVLGLIDLAHTAGSDGSEDFVGA